MEFKRIQTIEKELVSKRVLIIYGPRRIGKTTLVKTFAEKNNNKKVLFSVGDDMRLQKLFNSGFRKEILEWAISYEILIIDEAQYIKNIGQAIKMIIDEYPNKKIILTGSSSFKIAQNAGEPLTGRHFTMTLLPIMQNEIFKSNFEKKEILEDILIFGSYPEILLQDTKEQKMRILDELVNSYLFKDILILDKIKSPNTLVDILRALAFQIGNEVSFAGIGNLVGRDVKTIQRYIDILEKTFVVKQVKGYSKNLRNEISRKSKFYFYDLGVRNAIINQYNGIELRNDIGALWENFIFMELYKKSFALKEHKEFYFWRTHKGSEVDIVAEKDGELFAYECKWSKSDSRNLKLFQKSYPGAMINVVNKDNYLDFLTI